MGIEKSTGDAVSVGIERKNSGWETKHTYLCVSSVIERTTADSGYSRHYTHIKENNVLPALSLAIIIMNSEWICPIIIWWMGLLSDD